MTPIFLLCKLINEAVWQLNLQIISNLQSYVDTASDIKKQDEQQRYDLATANKKTRKTYLQKVQEKRS